MPFCLNTSLKTGRIEPFASLEPLFANIILVFATSIGVVIAAEIPPTQTMQFQNTKHAVVENEKTILTPNLLMLHKDTNQRENTFHAQLKPSI